jgi:hypothetical protein
VSGSWLLLAALAAAFLLWRSLRARAVRTAGRAGRPEQALRLELGFAADPVAASGRLTEALRAALRARRAGELEEVTALGGVRVFYLYGPDAERLLAAAREALAGQALAPGSRAWLRPGPPGVPERGVPLVGDASSDA